MRGIRSILFSNPADIKKLRTGLIIASCPDSQGAEIVRRVRAWMPHVEWDVVKRFEPGFEGFEGKIVYSSHAFTILRKIKSIRALRKSKYDVAVLAWTGDKSFNLLKIAGYFSNFRYLLIYNENYGAFFAVRKNRSFITRHVRWRMNNRKISVGRRSLLQILSWIFLYPPVIIFLALWTLFVILRKQFYSVSSSK